MKYEAKLIPACDDGSDNPPILVQGATETHSLINLINTIFYIYGDCQAPVFHACAEMLEERKSEVKYFDFSDPENAFSLTMEEVP
jgi:hypothetical protein